jgi:stage II sporulation protein D
MEKKLIWWAVIWSCSLVAASILIPGILVKKGDNSAYPDIAAEPRVELKIKENPLLVPVYLTKEQRIESVPLEQYIRGVLAAEMPAEFELEALKAQAIAARTYIMRRILDKDFSQVPVEGAWVTDTVIHQAYLTDRQLKDKWGLFDYAANMEKLNRAVNETQNLILIHGNRPIVAAFFSTSNGYTENSEDYWTDYVPYLRSVPSPWDAQISPRYKEVVRMSYREFARKLGVGGATPVSTGNSVFNVLETTEGNRIKKVKIGGKIFTGRQVREKLALNSSQFKFRIVGKQVEITTYGYGHGVGMSQWGANGMAKEGKKAEEILLYYYKGVRIVPADKLQKSDIMAAIDDSSM